MKTEEIETLSYNVENWLENALMDMGQTAVAMELPISVPRTAMDIAKGEAIADAMGSDKDVLYDLVGQSIYDHATNDLDRAHMAEILAARNKGSVLGKVCIRLRDQWLERAVSEAQRIRNSIPGHIS
jgi:hypothetical protein